MARVYQDAHVLESLNSAVKQLQKQTAELTLAKNLQEEKIKNLTTANQLLVAKNENLEQRIKANEHNTLARLSNLHVYVSKDASTSHTPLTPLWDVGTGRPMRNFPRHENDIKTMGQAEVIQCLQSLGVRTMGMTASQKKGRLRREIGLPGE